MCSYLEYFISKMRNKKAKSNFEGPQREPVGWDWGRDQTACPQRTGDRQPLHPTVQEWSGACRIPPRAGQGRAWGMERDQGGEVDRGRGNCRSCPRHGGPRTSRRDLRRRSTPRALPEAGMLTGPEGGPPFVGTPERGGGWATAWRRAASRASGAGDAGPRMQRGPRVQTGSPALGGDARAARSLAIPRILLSGFVSARFL